MKKVVLKSINSEGSTFHQDNGNVVIIARDHERVDTMVEWLFDNAKCRFVLLGTDIVYFEDDDDALLFMMTWG